MKNLKCKIINSTNDTERYVDDFLYNKDINIVSVNTVARDGYLAVVIIYSMDKET